MIQWSGLLLRLAKRSCTEQQPGRWTIRINTFLNQESGLKHQ